MEATLKQAIPATKPKEIKWVWTNGILCQRCKSARLCHVLSHADDRHFVVVGQTEHCDYLPEDLGIGGGQDNEFTLCFDCGQIQGKWPLPKTGLEQKEEERKNGPTQMGSKIPGSS